MFNTEDVRSSSIFGSDPCILNIICAFVEKKKKTQTNSKLLFPLIAKNPSKSGPPNVDHQCLPSSTTVNTLADI